MIGGSTHQTLVDFKLVVNLKDKKLKLKKIYRPTDKLRFRLLELYRSQKKLKILKSRLFMREIRLHRKLQEDENEIMLIYHKHKCIVSLFLKISRPPSLIFTG